MRRARCTPSRSATSVQEFLPETPYVLALIEFEGVNTLLLTRVMGVDPTAPSLDWIGMQVAPHFLRNSKFKPTDVYFSPGHCSPSGAYRLYRRRCLRPQSVFPSGRGALYPEAISSYLGGALGYRLRPVLVHGEVNDILQETDHGMLCHSRQTRATARSWLRTSGRIEERVGMIMPLQERLLLVRIRLVLSGPAIFLQVNPILAEYHASDSSSDRCFSAPGRSADSSLRVDHTLPGHVIGARRHGAAHPAGPEAR